MGKIDDGRRRRVSAVKHGLFQIWCFFIRRHNVVRLTCSSRAVAETSPLFRASAVATSRSRSFYATARSEVTTFLEDNGPSRAVVPGTVFVPRIVGGRAPKLGRSFSLDSRTGSEQGVPVQRLRIRP